MSRYMSEMNPDIFVETDDPDVYDAVLSPQKIKGFQNYLDRLEKADKAKTKKTFNFHMKAPSSSPISLIHNHFVRPTKDNEQQMLEERKVKALEKIANVLDALTLWFEDIDKTEWSDRTQWYLAEFHKKYLEETDNK